MCEGRLSFERMTIRSHIVLINTKTDEKSRATMKNLYTRFVLEKTENSMSRGKCRFRLFFDDQMEF